VKGGRGEGREEGRKEGKKEGREEGRFGFCLLSDVYAFFLANLQGHA